MIVVSLFLADHVLPLVLAVGVPALIVVFYLEGIIVGKLLQPPEVFIGAIVLTQPAPGWLAGLSISSAVAMTVGQWVVYTRFHPQLTARSWPLSGLLQSMVDWLSDQLTERVPLLLRLFDRFGVVVLFVGTILPGSRALVAVPAGIRAYSQSRFLLIILLANLLYFPLLAVVAFWLADLLGISGL